MNTTKKTPLPDDKNALKELIRKRVELFLVQQNTLDQKQIRIQFLGEQIILLKHGRFGKSGEALSYLNKNWIKLTGYSQDGRLNIDNNPVENAIRPFAIGRKNGMFSGSQSGGMRPYCSNNG